MPTKFTRSGIVDEAWSRKSALWQVDFMCAQVGLADLSTTDVLDVGCGVKLSSVFLNEDVPVQRYVGVDVHDEMIDFLRTNVDDPRFDYHHISLHNELYNPGGEPLTHETRLPVAEEAFDLICLFSVFTHLNPSDYHSMLRVLRRYVRSEGRLFFSLYVDKPSEGGHGFVDSLARLLEERPELISRRREDENPIGSTPKFRDVVPDHPLRIAMYSEDHALELIEDTGWRPIRLNDPGPFIQHSFVCEPV